MSNKESQGEENPYESPRTKSLAAKKPKINQVFEEPGTTLSLFLIYLLGGLVTLGPLFFLFLIYMQTRFNRNGPPFVLFYFELHPLLEIILSFILFCVLMAWLDSIADFYKRKYLHPLVVGDFAIIGIVKQRYKKVIINWSDITSYSLRGTQGLVVCTKDGKEYRFLTEKIPEHRLWKLEQVLAQHSDKMAQ